MKVAVPVWQGRVSPVFDVAGQIVLVDLVEGAEVSRCQCVLAETEPEPRVSQLAELQVETLICGAISRMLESLLVERGIAVHGRVCGGVEEVLEAFAAGRLEEPEYAMPGCCGGQRRRFRGGCRRGGGHGR